VGRLDQLDLSLKLSRAEESERLAAAQKRLARLRLELGGKRSLGLEGTILVKFFLHISDEEQLRRFRRRAADPLKRWKLTDEDWRNRAKRPAYEQAVEDMLERTDHELGRWQLVEADSKRFARVKVVETVIEQVDLGMRQLGFEPAPEADQEQVPG